MNQSLNNWVISKITDHSNVDTAKNVNDLINIERKDGENLSVAVFSETNLDISDINKFNGKDFDFLVNVPKDSRINASVINSLTSKKIGLGGMGDLFSVLGQKVNWPYTNREVEFIMRGLSQHTKVQSVERLDSRRYKVIRRHLPSVTILALNDYDLSVESVRNGKTVYKNFQAILTSNPNARVSGQAIAVASSMNIKILSWSELLGELNKKWS